MHVIAKRRLREFWDSHSGTEASLATWYQVVAHGTWATFAELRTTFASADQVGRLTVFNVKGNDVRVITRVDYTRRRVYVRAVLTHSEYDRDDWKKDAWF